MTRRHIQAARAIVTGASSGIGRHLALELAGQGARLVVTARREDRLLELVDQIRQSGGEAHCVPGDITDAQLRGAVLEMAHSELGGLDLLVNNAGVGAVGPFHKATEKRLRRVMEVNFFAPVELIRSALPLLREGRRPMIVNVGSVLGHRAVPNNCEYSASKFALHGFTDALRAELVRQGIDVLLVSPSTTDTDFFDSVLERKSELPWLKAGRMSPAAVARKTVKAIRRGRHEIILSAGGKLLVWSDRLWPGLVDWFVSKIA